MYMYLNKQYLFCIQTIHAFPYLEDKYTIMIHVEFNVTISNSPHPEKKMKHIFENRN